MWLWPIQLKFQMIELKPQFCNLVLNLQIRPFLGRIWDIIYLHNAFSESVAKTMQSAHANKWRNSFFVNSPQNISMQLSLS